ncbi:hypothetical protein I3842_13G113800 [Carya illinoinensis]|uniref:Secreted protein n=1 Tax=Carya illinoinensis TaxID=32201 RepID=A0A922DCY4_CARIL|nr:hypothetical protein I3842_13G113800 [Carya illinoinensis]
MNNGFILFRFSLLSLPASFFPPFSLSLVPSIEHRICGFFSFTQNRNKIHGFSPQIRVTPSALGATVFSFRFVSSPNLLQP